MITLLLVGITTVVGVVAFGAILGSIVFTTAAEFFKTLFDCNFCA